LYIDCQGLVHLSNINDIFIKMDIYISDYDTFSELHQVYIRKIGKTNNIKVFGSKKANGSKQDSHNQLIPTIHDEAQPNVSNRPCQCRNTDFWADYNYKKKKQKKT